MTQLALESCERLNKITDRDRSWHPTQEVSTEGYDRQDEPALCGIGLVVVVKVLLDSGLAHKPEHEQGVSSNMK